MRSIMMVNYKLNVRMDGNLQNGTMGEFNIWVPSGYEVNNGGKVTKD